MLFVRAVPAFLSSLGVALCAATTAWAGIRFEPVLMNDEQPPGLPPSSRIYRPAGSWGGYGQIADTGQVMIQSQVASGTEKDNAAWAGTPGSLQLIGHHGTSAPQLPGGVLDSLTATLSSDGHLAVVGMSAPDDQWRQSMLVWFGTPGAMQLVQQIQPTQLIAWGASSNGQIMVQTGTARNQPPWFWLRESIVAGPPGALRTIASVDMPAPGTDAKFTLGGEDCLAGCMWYRARISDDGQVAFFTPLSDRTEAIYSGPPHDIRIAVRSGSPALDPNLPADTIFQNLSVPVVGNAGRIAFTGWLAHPQTGASAGQSLWAGHSGDFRLVAREGDPAPGLSPDMTFGWLYDRLHPSCLFVGEHLLFTAELRGTGATPNSKTSLWINTGQYTRLLASEGDPCPGLGAGITFTRFGSMSDFRANTRGEAVFSATLSDGTSALYGIDAAGRLELLTHTGEVLRFRNSIRTIQSLRTLDFNDSGQVLLEVQFGTGSWGYMIGSGVPEPTTASLIAFAPLFALRRRR